MKIYADSSFIVSLYMMEPQTPAGILEVKKIQMRGESITLSELALLETTNAIHCGVFRNYISTSRAAKIMTALQAHIEAGIFRPMPVPALAWKTAREISASHATELGCRSFDILHVSIASLQKAELFLTFDRRQRALAAACGLNAPDLASDAR